jgi:glutamate/tyrosine decarboxylase-like PLP-dependent enzyme
MRHLDDWQASWGPFETHASLGVDPERLDAVVSDYLDRLTGGNYPFHHPRYAGQMLKPPHPVAIAAYLAAMRINPNNHALDGGPPTSHMEQEVVADLAAMLGLPDETLGHLTASGTIANLEALWVAREMHPDRGIAFSADAHYTHDRMAGVLNLETTTVSSDARGRIDLDALDDVLDTHPIGTVVLTPGTTGLGSVDRVDRAVDLCRQHDARLHVDAAYGGFFRLLADREESFEGFPAEAFRAIEGADSVVIDPHKHGLQPYGCGCVLFRDPTVGRFYKHDSPYTYFTSDELHLGEITLECSRAGAAAGALWCTLQALPLAPDDGLGDILAACLRAARSWADRIAASDVLTLYTPPETDIVAYFPTPSTPSLSAVNAASQRLFDAAMNDPDEPVFTSLYRLPAEDVHTLHPELNADCDEVAVLRSVLMKPEHETYAADVIQTLERRFAEL